MTTPSVLVELAKHVGHRTVLESVTQLRCHDCSRRVLLPAVAGSTSNVYEPPSREDARCAAHPWDREGSCRACASERLEAATRPVAPPTSSDAARAAARAALDAVRPRR